MSTSTGKRPNVDQGPGGVTTYLTLLGTVLACSHQKYHVLLEIVTYFGTSCGGLPSDASKKSLKMNESKQTSK